MQRQPHAHLQGAARLGSTRATLRGRWVASARLTRSSRAHAAAPCLAQGSKLERCSYCAGAFKPEAKGSLCAVCQMGEVGGSATGMVCYVNQLTESDM